MGWFPAPELDAATAAGGADESDRAVRSYDSVVGQGKRDFPV